MKVWWIVGVTVLCMALAFGYTKLLVKPWYESQAGLYVVSNNMHSSGDVTVANHLARDCMALIGDHNMLDSTLNRLRADGVNIPDSMTYRDLAKKIELGLSDEESRLIIVTVTDEDPAVAKAIVDAICDVAQNEINEAIGGDNGDGRIHPVGGENPATMPTEKAGPGLAKNMVIAGLIGFLISAGSVILIYVLDDKIKNSDQAERVLGMSTLGMIPHQKQNTTAAE
jgi:capsular polysaccharide biosynthesis protein